MAAKRQLEFSARSLANMEVIKLHIAADNPAAATKVIQSAFDFGRADRLSHVGAYRTKNGNS